MPGWYFWEEFYHKQRREAQRQRRKNKCVHVYNVERDGPIPPAGITNSDDRGLDHEQQFRRTRHA